MKSIFFPNRKNILILKGIKSLNRAFTGPKYIEIDLSGKCINKCIACWIHSPLFKKEIQKSEFLNYSCLKNQIKEFKKLKVEKIQIAGAGEPLLNPDFFKIIKELKNAGFQISIITSLYPMRKNLADFLVTNKIDNLTVSLWAGSSILWNKMHPGVNENAFKDICIFLEELKQLKIERNSETPRIKFYNVISSMNYDTLIEMLDFALNYHANELEFQTVDIIKGKTDFLELSKSQVEKVSEQFKLMRKRKDYTNQFIGEDNTLFLDFFNVNNEQKEFGRFFHPLKSGFSNSIDNKIFCPKKNANIKQSWVSDQPYPKLSFEWDNTICKSCDLSADCYPFPEALPLESEFLNLVGVGSFLRRIFSKANYEPSDCRIVNEIQCSVGWAYLRILSNGDVIPCCKASNLKLGSIKTNMLSEIWFSDKYNEFRKKALTLHKSDIYFKEIGCFKGCDNVGLNMEIKKMG